MAMQHVGKIVEPFEAQLQRAMASLPADREETCENHGQYTAKPRPFGEYSGCPKCAVEQAKAREKEHQDKIAAFEAERARRESLLRIENAAIPRRFIGRTLNTYTISTPAQQKVLSLCKDYAAGFGEHLETGRCLVLAGKVGTGKTHLACGILQELIEHRFPKKEGYSQQIGYRVLYTTASEIIRAIRATWGTKASEEQAIETFVRPSLLVVDEIGIQATDSERAQLSEVIDLRYRESLPTVIITNCDKAGLSQSIGERAVDRLRENGGLMCVLDWDSYRGKAPIPENSLNPTPQPKATQLTRHETPWEERPTEDGSRGPLGVKNGKYPTRY